MPKLFSRLPVMLAAALALAAPLAPAAAQSDYPNRPVRLIIPFPPGGSNDVVGRVIAQQLGESLGKQVIVDNRGGAGGVIGTELASKAAPDGYTLLVISLAHAVNPWLYKLPYDPIKAFEPIGVMAKGPVILSVYPGTKIHSVKDLLAEAKANPGKLQYASAGVGSFQHLSAELFKLEAKVDILHIPFKGGGPSMIDVMGGHSKVLFSSLVQTTPNIKSGKLRALAVGGTERSKVFPDLPTISEAGVPGYASENWWGIVAPTGTPKPIIEKLHKALEAAQDSTKAREYFDKEGAVVMKMSSADFGKFMVSEMNKWERVVKEQHIKPQ
jgi:tripartite-type tricarboxylate transporter receptor subunit TctC